MAPTLPPLLIVAALVGCTSVHTEPSRPYPLHASTTLQVDAPNREACYLEGDLAGPDGSVRDWEASTDLRFRRVMTRNGVTVSRDTILRNQRVALKPANLRGRAWFIFAGPVQDTMGVRALGWNVAPGTPILAGLWACTSVYPFADDSTHAPIGRITIGS